MTQTRKRLGDLLVGAGLITEEQLKTALSDKSKSQRLGDVLLQKGYITEQQLIEVLEFQLGVPHVSLYRYPFDPNLFNLIPEETAKRNLIVPLKKDGNRLVVAMSDPMDFYAIDDLQLATGFQIETAIATRDEILRTISKYYNDDSSLEELMDDLSRVETNQEDRQSGQEDAPVVRLVNQLLSNAVTQKASDIHIDPHETKLVIRYRVDGVLRVERVLQKVCKMC